ncbi:hypothetical protein [Robertkochia aurantiaca]|uniref:hypothetical protein n=1 Tax=Robertkochia aurantiaca TaxID=2873700 RepID=UPI001CC93B91|nr:hypothetical protein [Robertkochia sp. 3YJGBD-33]
MKTIIYLVLLIVSSSVNFILTIGQCGEKAVAEQTDHIQIQEKPCIPKESKTCIYG